MESKGERVKSLRKALNLSGETFGEKIGVTKGSINKIEKGVNNPSEQTLKLICREFNVNYFWLRDGEGDMFVDVLDDLIDKLAVTCDMDEFEKKVISTYLKLPKEQRSDIFVKRMFDLD